MITRIAAIFGSQQFSVVMEDEESIQRAMEAKDALVHISMSSSPSAVGTYFTLRNPSTSSAMCVARLPSCLSH